MEERTPCSDIDFRIKLLTEADCDSLAGFVCGVAELDDFFHFEVRQCIAHHYLAVYCAYLDSNEIVALFTLMNDALMISGQS